jgi:hypothetical protein
MYGGVAPPTWVLRSGGRPATFDLDFENDLSWFNEVEDDIAAVLPAARLDAGGVEVLSSEPDNLVINTADIRGFREDAFSIVTHATSTAPTFLE